MPTFGSLFSGIGGFDLGLERAGWDCRWQVELLPFRRSVLACHWPDVPQHEDVTTVDPTALEPVDLLCGGFPCQDLSVAGRRAGLAGTRSSLFFEFARFADALRPRWLLVENVPGLLSSHKGRDFAVVLATLAELGYGVAWRVLDSRYFGVPQRRRRVFIVGRLGARSAEPFLPFLEGLSGDSAPRAAPGTDVASTLGGGSGSRGWCDDFERGGGLSLSGLGSGGPDDNDAQAGRLLALQDVRGLDKSQNGIGVNEERIGYTLDGTGAQGVAIPLDLRNAARASGNGAGTQGDGIGAEGDPSFGVSATQRAIPGIAHALTSEGYDASEDGTGRGTPIIAQTVTRSYARTTDAAGSHGAGPVNLLAEPAYALRRDPGGTGQGHNTNYVTGPMAVRRLTPVECARLQGFPDDWLGEPNEQPDGPRYAALGDAVTVNVAEWIGHRLLEADA